MAVYAMEEELFNELLASVREMKAIMRVEIAPSRIFEINEMDVKQIRAQ